MKNLVFSMLAMAAMVSCTSESDPISEITGDKVEIKLNAGFGVETKAPVTSSETGILDKALEGIQIVKTVDIESSPAWGDVTTVASTAKITTANLASGTLTFGTPLYYNADKTLNSYLIGYYPACDADYPSNTNKGKLQWTITGKEDILFASEVSGNKDTEIPSITFNHELLQLQFKFKAENQNDIDAWGSISEIVVKTEDASTSTLKNLHSVLTYVLPNTPTWSNDETELKVFKVDGSDYKNNPIDNSTNSVTLTTSETLGGYIMVEPLTAATDYTLIIKTSKNTAGVEVPITLGGAPAKGNAYEVTLTFKATTISANATITSWEQVPGGSGEVK